MAKLPLLQTKFPAPSDTFNKPIITIASFDFLQEFDIMGKFFHYPDAEVGDRL